MIGIYKITSPSGKVYIGQSININNRKKQYINYIKNNSSIGPHLMNSFKKYSFEGHNFEILEECKIVELDENETHYKKETLIQCGNDWSKVLFCGLYDSGGGPKSEETKKKMSISQIKNLSKPEVKLIRKINCKISANKPFVQAQAVANTDWVKREINRLKSMDYNKLKKPLVQYDLQGNSIKEWDGFIDIKKTLNYDSSYIRKCCNSTIKTAYGFKWRYKKDLDN
jgi:group I intron endonuclease